MNEDFKTLEKLVNELGVSSDGDILESKIIQQMINKMPIEERSQMRNVLSRLDLSRFKSPNLSHTEKQDLENEINSKIG